MMLFLIWAWQETLTHATVQTISYSEFKQYLRAGEVVDCQIGETELEGHIQPKPGEPKAEETKPEAGAKPEAAAKPETAAKPATPAKSEATPEAKPAEAGKATDAAKPEPSKAEPGKPEPGKPFQFRTIRVEDQFLTADLEKANVKFTGLRPSFLQQLLTGWMFPLIVMIVFWVAISRFAGRAGGALMNIGKSRAHLVMDKETGVTFGDVAGCDEAKFELQEVVDFLRSPGRYQALGAKIPKGVLLVGPPGTGKTLLGKAVAGEAGVPFFSLSGSDFVEMFVGVGAARVRDLFQQAKVQSPCIIFIDELDAIGRQRGVHVGFGGHDEREQTLNALLVEMDGFDPNVGVILLAATNRPEVLDRALLRPGRFDRQVIVDSPDIEGREAILKVHSRDKKIGADVDLAEIASATPGFSGADLANLLNEAALLAARRGAHAIEQLDLREAIEKVVAGPERKSRRLSADEKRRVAFHEVGHALVAAYSPSADPVRKISIVPRGRAALGYTMQSPAAQQFLMTRRELEERIRGLLGGRAAEEVVFTEVTTGAENDLDRATTLARQMVCVFGMSDAVGLTRCVHHPASPFLADGEMQRDCSEQTAELIDAEVKRLLDTGYADAKRILTEHRDQLDLVTEELIKRESLDAAAFYGLIGMPVPSAKEHSADQPPPIGEEALAKSEVVNK